MSTFRMLTILGYEFYNFRLTFTLAAKFSNLTTVKSQTSTEDTITRSFVSKNDVQQCLFRSSKLWRVAFHTNTHTEDYLDYATYKSIPSLRSLQLRMDASPLLPPLTVRGMTSLKREAFEKNINVPYVRVKSEQLQKAVKNLKKYMLKMDKLKPVQTDVDNEGKKVVLLNPLLVKGKDDIKKGFDELNIEGHAEFLYKEITLGYENWKAEDIIKAIFPENVEGAQGYSIIGHILHLNLREHVLPYKTVIGEVLLEKIPNISLVVNKTNVIDNTYRNFAMEVLAGIGKTDVTVKENGCSFSFDFAKVYWNPRLSTEHERIIRKVRQGDVLYDVMAGVGPFAIPCGKKNCRVLANDLNPNSYEALVKNCSSNKVTSYVSCFNLDGNEFIKTILMKDLLETWNDSCFIGSVHIVMNLPAMAVEFLPSFVGLFKETESISSCAALPMVHVYLFIKDTEKDTAISAVAEKLGHISYDAKISNVQLREMSNNVCNVTSVGDNSPNLKNACDINTQEMEEVVPASLDVESFRIYVNEVVFVRAVAPNKNMMRVSFKMPLEVLLGRQAVEPLTKKFKSS